MKYFIIFIFLKLFIVSSYPDFTIKKEEESIIIQEVYIDRRDNVSDKMISLEDDYYSKYYDFKFNVRDIGLLPIGDRNGDRYRKEGFISFFHSIKIKLYYDNRKKCQYMFSNNNRYMLNYLNKTSYNTEKFKEMNYLTHPFYFEIPDDYELNDCLDIMESNLFLHKISTSSKRNLVFDVMKKYHMFLYNQRNNLEFNNKLIELNNEFETLKDKIREDNEIFMKELEEKYIFESEKIKDFNKKICYYFLPFIVILSLFLIYISTFGEKKENIDIIYFNKMISKNREKIEDIYIKNENYIKIIEKYKKDNEYKNKIIKKLLIKL